MTQAEAIDLTGGLSQTSKMPGPSWSISAFDCKTGSILAKIPGTVCNKCYARRHRYNFSNVKATLRKRLKLSRGKLWARAMMTLILDSGTKHFRWFDSGDLQDKGMVERIITVAKATPHVMHWLPTKEYLLVKGVEFPPNVVVRVSAHKIGANPPKFKGLLGSGVFDPKVGPPSGGFVCEAKSRGNKCGDCRACWDPNVPVVWYPEH